MTDAPRITIRLGNELNRRLRDAARGHSLPAAEFARRVLAQSLDGQDRRMNALEQSLQRITAYSEELLARSSESRAQTQQASKLASVLERVVVLQTEALMILRVQMFRSSPEDYKLALAKAEDAIRSGFDHKTSMVPAPVAESAI